MTTALLVVCIIAFRWLRPGYLIGTVDFFPDFMPFHLLAKSTDAWGTVKGPFGGYDFPTYAPLYLVAGVLAKLLGDSAGQIAIMAGVIYIAWSGLYLVGRRIGLGAVPSAVGATFYALGPNALSSTLWISSGSFLALFPWVIYAIITGTDPKARRSMALIVSLIASAALPLVGSTPQLLFAFILGAIAFYVFCCNLVHWDRNYIFWGLKVAAIAFLCSLWWVIPVVVAILSSEVTHTTDLSKVAFTFRESSLLNCFRFITAWTWSIPDSTPFALAYNSNIITYAGGFVGSLGLIVACAYSSGKLSNYCGLFLGLALAGFFITKGLHPPFVFLNQLVLKLPGFLLLIEPAGATLIALLSVSLGLGIALQSVEPLARSLRFHRFARVAVIAAVIGLIMATILPMWSGSLFVTSLGSMYVRLPNYWRQAATYVDNRQRQGSVLILPGNSHYQRGYDWGYTGVDIIPAEVFTRDTLIPGPSLDYLDDPRTESITNELGVLVNDGSPLLLPALRSLGIRFVVCRLDLDRKSNANFCGVGKLVKKFGYTKFGKLVVVNLNNVTPQMAEWSHWIFGEYRDISPGEILELGSLTLNAPRISINSTERYSNYVRTRASFHEISKTSERVTLKKNEQFIATSKLLGPSSIINLERTEQLSLSFARAQKPIPIFSIGGLVAGRLSRLFGTILPERIVRTIGVDKAYLEFYNVGSQSILASVTMPAPPSVRASIAVGFNPAPVKVARLHHNLVVHNIMLNPGVTQLLVRGVPLSDVGEAVLRREQLVRRKRSSQSVLSPIEPYLYAGFSLGRWPIQPESIEVSPTFRPGALGVVISYHVGASQYACHSFLYRARLNIATAIDRCESANSIDTNRHLRIIDRIDFANDSTAPMAKIILPRFTLFAKDGLVRAAASKIKLVRSGVGRMAYRLYSIRRPRRFLDRSIVSLRTSSTEPVGLQFSHGGGAGMQVSLQAGVHSVQFPLSMVFDGRGRHRTALLRVNSRSRLPSFAVSIKTSSRGGGLLLSSRSDRAMVNAARGGVVRIGVSKGLARMRLIGENGAFSVLSLGREGIGAKARLKPAAARSFFHFGSIRAVNIQCGECAITNSQLYSGGWVAFLIGPNIQRLPHVLADGWENAWLSPRPGIVIIGNVVTVLETLAGLLALFVIAWQATRK